MSTPPLQHGQGEERAGSLPRGERLGAGSRRAPSTGPVLLPWPQRAPGTENGSPAPCSLSSAVAKQAGCSAAARTIVIILINPLHTEYCGLLAGPSHTISISRQAGGSQIAHAG